MPLVINALGADTQTDRQTHILKREQKNFKKLGTHSILPHVPGLNIHTLTWLGSDFVKAVKMKSWLPSLGGFNYVQCVQNTLQNKSISILGGLLACPQKIYALRLNLMLSEAQNCYAKDNSLWESVVSKFLNGSATRVANPETVVEIRVRNWSDVFLKMGHFVDY